MNSSRVLVVRELAALLAQLDQSDLGVLFDFFDDTLFWIKDSQGKYLRVNQAFQLGFSLPSTEAVVGLTDLPRS